MSNHIERPRHLLPWASATVALTLAGQLFGQTFTVLHTFSATDTNGFNSDGANVNAPLWLSDGTLYGEASAGGTGNNGTLFKINIDGTGFTNLHSFSSYDSYNPDINTDGAFPFGGLVSSGSAFYGTAYHGGSSGYGTVFSLAKNGTGFTNLYSFSAPQWDPSTQEYVNSDGYSPQGGLFLSGNTLYGTAFSGGNFGSGTLFSLGTDGSGFTAFYDFTAISGAGIYQGDGGNNKDGANPNGGLLFSGNRLYGTTYAGGCSVTFLPTGGAGTVFSVNPDGTDFTTLHCFTGSGGQVFSPIASLVLAGDTLYGTTSDWGYEPHAGTVFKINTNGTGFMILHTFTVSSFGPPWTNTDGGWPAGLVLAGNNLYGTTYTGGNAGNGTVYTVHTDGTGFKVLHAFAGGSGTSSYSITNSSGARPAKGLVLWGNTLYGATYTGGTWGNGTIFSIKLPSIPPQLTIMPDGSGGYLINAQGSPNFTCQLQRAPALPGPWSTSASQTADTNGLIQFHDLFPPPDRAFYRTEQQ